MSREMWEFDVNGEMYHEKVINFLGELFANWKVTNKKILEEILENWMSAIYISIRIKLVLMM